jgi:type IV secretion system protein VirB9
MPVPSSQTPRVQTAQWSGEQTIMLMALPETALTVMLEPGETITRATLTGSSFWEVKVSQEADAFQVTARTNAEPAELQVETDRRSYRFGLEAGEGLMAAYLVRMEYSGEGAQPLTENEPEASVPTDLNWSYRLKGDRAVRPASIRDNGRKTVITYAPGQPLPAVFAIGATGDEEVVDGYMRGEAFVIDRVHSELVFRIDKEKATARRNAQEDAQP